MVLIIVRRSPPVQNRTSNAASHRFYARNGSERSEQIPLRSHDADLAVGNSDPLGQGTEVVATIAAALDPYPVAGRGRELAQHRCGEGLLSRAFERGLGARSVGLPVLFVDRLP